MAELLESAEGLGIDLSAPWYNIILFKTQSLRHAQDEYSGSLIRIEQELRSLEDGRYVIAFDRNLEGKAFLLKADSEEQLLLNQQEYIEKIKDIMEGYEHIRYFGGIGKPVNRLRELPVSFEQASHAFAHRYLVQDSRILDSGHMVQEVVYFVEEFFKDLSNKTLQDSESAIHYITRILEKALEARDRAASRPDRVSSNI